MCIWKLYISKDALEKVPPIVSSTTELYISSFFFFSDGVLQLLIETVEVAAFATLKEGNFIASVPHPVRGLDATENTDVNVGMQGSWWHS